MTNDEERFRETFLACASGDKGPDVIWCDGRTIRAMGGDIADEDLDVMFELHADGTGKRLT